MKRFSFIFSIFLFLHCVAIVAEGLFGLRTPLRSYLEIFQIQQKWDMFTTAPYFNGIEIAPIVRAETGEEKVFGPVLPGFLPDDGSRRYRHYWIYAAIPSHTAHKTYIKAACNELLKTRTDKFELYLRVTRHYINSLQHIRESREIATSKTELLGPYRCDE